MRKSVINKLSKNYFRTGTQKGAIIETLYAGTEFSVAEAQEAGISNPTSVVSQLREHGYSIYSNPRKTTSGTVNRYRLN
jgi:hypothetical protein